MCEPVSIISLALAAAGTAASAYGAHESQVAQDKAINNSVAAQTGLQNQSNNLFNQSLAQQNVASTQDKMAANATTRADEYAQANINAGTLKPQGTNAAQAGTTTGPRVVQDAYAAQAAKVGNYLKQQGLANANLQSFADTTLQNSRLNQNMGNQQNILAGFMRNNSSLLPIQQYAASQAGNTAKGVGGLLSAAGSVTGMGASTGALSGVGSSLGGSGTVGGSAVQQGFDASNNY